ncbi:SDR family NAD(P)-dependent oxidoreductase [Rubritalea tangerina]|uniref:SDR family NAD(P)-dependent oxidoreductase n=1 Tax=Rubritalea tangerina TaxID=430798 RepID=A0ABW4ZCU3_9BACT
MQKTIFITGATDGIGLETSKLLASKGAKLLLHGRNQEKLESVAQAIREAFPSAHVEVYLADLQKLEDVKALISQVRQAHKKLDVLINNAGVFNVAEVHTKEGYDVRFIVNTVAPYLLTQGLWELLKGGRVVNLSSAAQSSVDLEAMLGKRAVEDMAAYAQSKLALTMWSRVLGGKGGNGPLVVAVNPGSLLGSKMVKSAFGVEGGDLNIGASILVEAALSESFEKASGLYFDNDKGRFASPHLDAMHAEKCQAVINAIEAICRAS